MTSTTDAVGALEPPLRVGERVSLRVADDDGRRELIGFVTALSDEAVGVVDRRGTDHVEPRARVDAARRVAVALGRRPEATPRALLDALAARAEASGTPWVARISALLEHEAPPQGVPAWGEWASFGDVRARFEGEWVTLPAAPLTTVVDAAWWGTRMGARSVLLLADAGADLSSREAGGFVRVEGR